MRANKIGVALAGIIDAKSRRIATVNVVTAFTTTKSVILKWKGTAIAAY
jgi:hypothetical protein